MNIIFQSLVVYLSLALALYFLGKVSQIREERHRQGETDLKFFTWDIYASLFIFAFISGIRWNVGADYQNYRQEFIYAQNFGYATDDFEIGFRLFTKFIAGLGLHYSFYFSLIAFAQIYFVYMTFKNERKLLPYVGIMVVLGFHYLSWMNGMRQMLAATLFLYSIRYISNRNIFAYISIILLASLIHKSSLILIVAYAMPSRDIFYSRILTLSLAAVFIYIGSYPIWVSFVADYISALIGIVGYDRYSSNIGMLAEISDIKNFGPRMISSYFLFFITVIFSPYLKRKFDNNYFLFYYNFYVIGFLINCIFINSHHVFLRPVSYLTICSIPVLSYFLYYLQNKKDHGIIYMFVLISSISYTPLSLLADYQLGDYDYSNFKFFWIYD